MLVPSPGTRSTARHVGTRFLLRWPLTATGAPTTVSRDSDQRIGSCRADGTVDPGVGQLCSCARAGPTRFGLAPRGG
eukprot:2605959-Lingulodinium_polyedra.AAC.1